ncbi:uncharacterized protein PB18E9.04c isoform X1 [Sorghum bicolor]|uniref:LisH domain-containing protein n=1 Tax=Sorghum bicolor TaxID=4558 RepID=A0A1W0W5Y9_SORBI|nr:uncharacterized protein PB18E9.04c isoform X1 [Sorghum bicolor]OQU89807.1 hypothetical protein SORBI_3002G272300 [Sorghum bicolor]|eukprot:XP_021308471.1 uncharacterized protein PB18E9.04c isoform X1 [Sorghum bicolor]
MAPPPPNPKPATPPDSSTSKKKVTPAEVAFLVDRYLADNGFNAALAAFRSDAGRIYSPTKKTPKRPPIPLADILDEYIALKGASVAIESTMRAMQSLVSTYYASSSSTPPPVPPHVNMNMNMMMMPPLPPSHAVTGAQPSSPPLFFAPNSSSPPSQGTAGHASPLIHHYAHASTAVLVHNSSADLSTQAPTSLPTNKKRKASKSSGKTTASASKRSCIAPATTTDAKGRAVPVASHLSKDQKMASAAHPTSVQHSAMTKLPLQTSSVAKSLFRPLPPPAHSSPYTPQQSNPVQDQPAAYPSATPASAVANAHAQQDIGSSQCSIVSSKTLIVSPLKGSTYYAVERSYHVSSPLKPTIRSSPLKPTTCSSPLKPTTRKLDFDCTEPGPSDQIYDKTSTSSDEDKQYDFDIDFTNFDICDGEFSFSELLLDFDLDNEGVLNPSTSAEVQRLEPVGHMAEDPVLPDSVKPVAADSAEDLNQQAGATSVTSVRAITKRIKIVSPVKGRPAS